METESACRVAPRTDLGEGGSRAERAAAAACLLRVRIVEHETPRQQRSVVVERRAVQEQQALAIDVDLRAVLLEDLIANPRLLLPGERVAQARTAAALHAHTETALVDALFGHQRLDLLRSGLADLNHEFNAQCSMLNAQRCDWALGIVHFAVRRWAARDRPMPARPCPCPASPCSRRSPP